MLTQDEAGKPKDLDAAINHFLMAAQLDPTEIMFLINIAEAKHQQKKYAECVEFCERAVKVGKENKADAEKVEKALALQAAAEKDLVVMAARVVWQKEVARLRPTTTQAGLTVGRIVLVL